MKTRDQASFDVRAFGAVGDGVTKDTAAIQRAIDACAAAGGGRVLVPAGRYLTGTIYLKSHVELHLAAGATLLASPDRRDYNPDDVFPENPVFAREEVSGAHLIIAYRQENVALTGPGTIDGHSSAFFKPWPADQPAPTYRHKAGNYPIDGWRPGQMVFFCRCRRVAVRDVALVNSPYWTLFLLGCEDVQIRGLTITNPPATRNGDGIDLDCCRRVTVSDCLIRSGDDCITVRGNTRPLGGGDWPSEDVVVTNCVLSSPCNAIRVGVGDGVIRRCTFSHIVIAGARTAINLVSRYSASGSHGVHIEQVHFSDFTIDACLPIVMAAGPDAAPPAAIRDISFTRFRATASAGSQLVGSPNVPLQRIRLTDFDLHVRGGTSNRAFTDAMPEVVSHFGYPGVGDRPALPCALYGVHLEDAVFDNIRVRWEQPGAVWRDGLFLERSSGVDLRHLVLRQPQADGGAAVRCRESRGLSLHSCRAEPGTRTFLHVEASPPDARIRCTANDFLDAEEPLDADAPVVEAGNLCNSAAAPQPAAD